MGLLCEFNKWGCCVRFWSIGLLCEFGQWGCCVSLVNGVAV